MTDPEVLRLRKVNSVLFSRYQQALEEAALSAELDRDLKLLMKAHKERVRRVRAMAKARP